MSTWKQIEQAREVRLWLTQIIAPTAMVVTAVMSVPEVRKGVVNKFNSCKEKIEKKIKKKEKEA